MPKQNSNEWTEVRKHRITASRFGDVLAGPKTKRHKNYMQEIIDNINGVPNFDDNDKPWFSHGKEWEAQARAEYEWQTSYEVIQDFFFVHPDLPFVGSSPDGFIEPDGNLEIKCHKGIPDIITSVLPATYKPQVMGEMWVTGRAWTDFVDFYKEELTGETEISILRVYPDKKYFKKLETACVDFWGKIQERLPKHLRTTL